MREVALFGGFGVAGRSVGHPHGAGGVLDAVPDPPAGGDFVLPLLEVGPVDVADTERAFERVLTVVSLAGSLVIRSHAVRAFAGTVEQICSQPVTASLVAYRNSQPPADGGGATRSRRFGTVSPQVGPQRNPLR